MSSKYTFDPNEYKSQLSGILLQIDSADTLSEQEYSQIVKQFPKDDQGLFAKSEIISAYKHFGSELKLKTNQNEFLKKLKKKPIRTMSGVTPVTVLTKPFPCPGKCIFCPNDVRMPKSYLSDEPGAQRATRNAFDPYLQTWNRLQAFAANGHSVDKVELIILGGTWSFYPEAYQVWFIKRCFDALNDFGDNLDNRHRVKKAYDFKDQQLTLKGEALTQTYNQVVSGILIEKQNKRLLNQWESAEWSELEAAQQKNETSKCRNVGLVIETRPDNISQAEVIRVRRLGCTKTQIGFQSLDDKVLELNKRGHNVAATRKAVKLLRQAGFKIHAHWMANLYGANVKSDIADYQKLFSDPDFRPDELKIYPCSLIETAELMGYYQQGLWQPYTHDELLEVLTEAIKSTPEYCRLTRVIRDIPSDDIVVGNKLTNFRQIAEAELDKQGINRQDIRSREIKNKSVKADDLTLKTTRYRTSCSKEVFMQYVTHQNEIVGFLRLSLPTQPSFIDEIEKSALIREVHVYGIALNIGEQDKTKSQHLGLGTKMIDKAKRIASDEGFTDLAVISAIGTREYYRKLGFNAGKLYQHIQIKDKNKLISKKNP